MKQQRFSDEMSYMNDLVWEICYVLKRLIHFIFLKENEVA